MEQIVELSDSKGKLKISRTTTMEIGGEMAFWMRWGMDHIGDTSLPTNSVLYGWNPGSVSDEERVSREIESVEVEQFQREMVKRFRTYMTDVNGMQIDSGELLGEQGDFDTISVSVDLMGETKVVNHPLKIIFSTLQTVDSDERFYLMRTFTSTQSAPLWQEYSLFIEATSTGMTSFADAELLESDDLSFSHSRMPWGEKITIEGEKVSLSEDFTISIQPTKNILYAPISLIALAGAILLVGFFMSLGITKSKHRRFLMFELILIPLVLVIYFFSYPPMFVGASSGIVTLIWLVTSIASPRKFAEIQNKESVEETTLPTIKCPACNTLNIVTSDERPLRITCTGCGKAIKIVG